MQPDPLYARLKAQILREIVSGNWPPGRRVPSENELTRQHGVSRMTANRALRELTSEGRLVRLRGSGTFVAEPAPSSDLLVIRNIAEEIRARGHRHEARVRRLRREPLPPDLVPRFALAEGAAAFHSLIVHLENGRPIQFEDRWVDPAMAPGYLENDFTRITPHEFLSRVAPLSRAEHVVEALLPPTHVRAWLDMGGTEPALRLERRTWSGERVVSRALLWHPGSRYRLGAAIGLDIDRAGSKQP
ncbi:MAG: histidine utilization repressor [Alphaproteobacteria bacterium]|nr:histidine utilization repressor [Alphaproteobacteria bacterium]